MLGNSFCDCHNGPAFLVKCEPLGSAFAGDSCDVTLSVDLEEKFLSVQEAEDVVTVDQVLRLPRTARESFAHLLNTVPPVR